MNQYQELCLAASRGATIQAPDLCDGKWFDIEFIDWSLPQMVMRIHPKDTHYRFGPISKVFYDAAVNPPDTLINAMPVLGFFGTIPAHSDWSAYDNAPSATRSTFLLLMAEALASEGL